MFGIQTVQKHGGQYTAAPGKKGGGNIIVFSVRTFHREFRMLCQDSLAAIGVKIQSVGFPRCLDSLLQYVI